MRDVIWSSTNKPEDIIYLVEKKGALFKETKG